MRSIVAAVLLALLLSASAGASTAHHGRSRLSERELAKRARVHQIYRFCNTYSCVRRVTHKRARRAARYWNAQRRALSPGVKAMLARLRGCETRGIPYPQNYRWKGHHRGAYQYLFSTWARAGGHGDPADASPAEQDVRTARFFPSHRGEWACKA